MNHDTDSCDGYARRLTGFVGGFSNTEYGSFYVSPRSLVPAEMCPLHFHGTVSRCRVFGVPMSPWLSVHATRTCSGWRSRGVRSPSLPVPTLQLSFLFFQLLFSPPILSPEGLRFVRVILCRYGQRLAGRMTAMETMLPPHMLSLSLFLRSK